MFVLVEVWPCISPSLLSKCCLKKMGRSKDNILIFSVPYLQGMCFSTVKNVYQYLIKKTKLNIKPL